MNVSVQNLWCLREYAARIIIICRTTCLLSHKVFLDMFEVTQLVKELLWTYSVNRCVHRRLPLYPPVKLIELIS